MALISRSQVFRLLYRSCPVKITSHFLNNEAGDIKKILRRSEKIIGYQVSYLSLRHLFDSELLTHLIKNFSGALSLDHDYFLFRRTPPAYHTIKLLALNLLSKSLLHQLDDQYTYEVTLKHQRIIDVAELSLFAADVHGSIGSLPREVQATTTSDCNHEIKKSSEAEKSRTRLSILGGDFLWAKATKILASLKNTDIVYIISESIGDIAKSHFVLSDSLNRNELTFPIWKKFSFLRHGSIIASCCRCITKLSEKPHSVENFLSAFGENFSYLIQLSQLSQFHEAVQLDNSLWYCDAEKLQNLRKEYGNLSDENLKFLPASEAARTLQELVRFFSTATVHELSSVGDDL